MGSLHSHRTLAKTRVKPHEPGLSFQHPQQCSDFQRPRQRCSSSSLYSTWGFLKLTFLSGSKLLLQTSPKGFWAVWSDTGTARSLLLLPVFSAWTSHRREKKHPNKITQQRPGLFRFVASEVVIHAWLPPFCFYVCEEAQENGGRVWWNKAVCSILKGCWESLGSHVPFKGIHLITQAPTS